MTGQDLTLDQRRDHLRRALKAGGDAARHGEQAHPSRLRQAMKAGSDEAVALLRTALAGATEDERKLLAKTLPPSRWFKEEGPTLRACFAFAALGSPKHVVEAVFPIDSRKALALSSAADTIRQGIVEGLRDRDESCLYAFLDVLAEDGWVMQELCWRIARDLIAARGLRPASPSYLRRFVQVVSGGCEDGGAMQKKPGEAIAQALLADADLLAHEFPQLFRVEGMGGDYFLTDWNADAWDGALLILCERLPDFRGTLLRESLDALLRDFSAKNITWYLRVHRLLDPTPEEIAHLAPRYCAVLSAQPSTSVGLAQDMLLRGAKAGVIGDAEALIDASGAVLLRTEKKLLKAQLAILAALAAHPARRPTIGALVEGVRDALPPDLQGVADKLVAASGTARAAAPVAVAGEPVAVPPPRRVPLPAFTDGATPITDDEMFAALAAAQLEGVGDGADLPRILAWWAAHPSTVVDAALLRRAQEIVNDVWDSDNLSPRRHLAALLLARAGGAPKLEFRGYRRHVYVHPGQADPQGAEVEDRTSTSHSYDPDSGQWRATETHHYRSGYQFVPTHTPAGLLAEQFRAQPVQAPLPHHPRAWERVLGAPGEGTYSRELEILGNGPRAFWRIPGESAPHAPASMAERAFDVSPVQAEYTFRAQEAREQDGYEQIVQWAAWLLRDHPATLAAQFHPTLYTATAVVNVRGVGTLLAALGASRLVPQGPEYSALALGLSAKEAAHRAQAAEAVAALAASGLLDPEPFAAEIGAHLAEGFVMAGRVAQALADAASIHALSGYRVLQILAALLPHLDGVTGAAKLVELAARLSADYGTPIALPDALAGKAKGGSVMAVALRALAAVNAGPTDLARQAGAQARATHDPHDPQAPR